MQKIHINLLLPQLFWSFVSAMSQTHNINVNVDEWELQVHDVNALSTSIQPLLCSQLMTSSRQDIISPQSQKANNSGNISPAPPSLRMAHSHGLRKPP